MSIIWKLMAANALTNNCLGDSQRSSNVFSSFLFPSLLTLTATGGSASPKLCTARLCRFESLSQSLISGLVLVSPANLKDHNVLSCISNLGALLSRRGHFLLKWDEADRHCVYLPTHNFEWWADTVSIAWMTSKLTFCNLMLCWVEDDWKPWLSLTFYSG